MLVATFSLFTPLLCGLVAPFSQEKRQIHLRKFHHADLVGLVTGKGQCHPSISLVAGEQSEPLSLGSLT